LAQQVVEVDGEFGFHVFPIRLGTVANKGF
jgi:hypothetical protein